MPVLRRPEADRAGRWRCGDCVVVVLDMADGRRRAHATQCGVEAGVEILRRHEPEIIPLRRHGDRSGDLRTRHVVGRVLREWCVLGL